MVDRRKTEPSQAAQASRYLGIGLTWALSTALFLYLGSLADERFGSTPWLTLIGAFVGAAAGFHYMYHHLVVVPQRTAGRRPDGPDSTGPRREPRGPGEDGR